MEKATNSADFSGLRRKPGEITVLRLKNMDRGIPALFMNSFIAAEPMACRQHLDFSGIREDVEKYCEKAIFLGFSYEAVDRETGSPAGLLFASDITHDWSDPVKGASGYFSWFQESMALIERLESPFLATRNFSPAECLHIFQIGVDPLFRGRGIAKSLIRTAVDHAFQRGYSTILADATGIISRRCFLSCGFSEETVVQYVDFEFRGEYFFKDLPGRISLMVQEA
jgi:ribosomal protein S18 acetylase RimI-like enzyme